jgi:hypothetical protein
MSIRPIEITEFLGIRNTSPIRSIPNNALSFAQDVNLSDTGVLTQREGFPSTPSVPLTNVTLAYVTLDQSSYVVANGIINRFNDDLSYVAIAPCNAVALTDFGKTIFTSDGLRILDDKAINIKLETPNLPPTLTLISGSLPASSYNSCYTYRSIASKLESGSSPPATIELTDDTHGFAIAPVTPPDGYTVVYYTTDVGGSVYYDNNGVPLQQSQVLANPFPNDIEHICFHHSRLWVSRTLPEGGSILWYSDAFLYHIYDMVGQRLMIPGKILAMASLAAGLLVCTDVAIWLCDENSMTLIADYGVVPGKPLARTADGTVYIHTVWGSGTAYPFDNLTYKKFSAPPGTNCTTAMVYKDGIEAFIVLSDGLGKPFNSAF